LHFFLPFFLFFFFFLWSSPEEAEDDAEDEEDEEEELEELDEDPHASGRSATFQSHFEQTLTHSTLGMPQSHVLFSSHARWQRRGHSVVALEAAEEELDDEEEEEELDEEEEEEDEEAEDDVAGVRAVQL